MNTPTGLGRGAFPVLFLVLACSPDSGRDPVSPELSVANGASGPAASGHANWINVFGEYVSRTFHARAKADGTVDGNFVQHITSTTGVKRVNKGDIDCLLVGPIPALGLGPNEAVLSGPIHENVNPDLIGWTQIFRVQDNGEGSGRTDKQSQLVFRSPESGVDCRSLIPAAVTPIESGNIQVKP